MTTFQPSCVGLPQVSTTTITDKSYEFFLHLSLHIRAVATLDKLRSTSHWQELREQAKV